MKKTILLTSLVIAATSPFAFAQTVNAAGSNVYGGGSNCQVVYGGGKVCPTNITISLDKQVLQPGQDLKGKRLEDLTYVQNLSTNTEKFGVTDTIIYKISIKNTGSDKINKVTITDTLPNEVNFRTGPGTVSRDSQNRQVVDFTLTNLEANQTIDSFLTVDIAQDRLANQSVDCFKNTVRATADNKDTRTDEAEACVERQITGKGGPVPTVFPPTKAGKTPGTGPEMLSLLGLIPTGIAGFFLRKKSVSI